MEQSIDCPCPKTTCEHYLKCDECRENHKDPEHPVFCERKPEEKS